MWPLDHHAPRAALLRACVCAQTHGRAAAVALPRCAVEAVLRDVRFTQLGGRDGWRRSCGSVYACFAALFLRAKPRGLYVTGALCSTMKASTVTCGANNALVAIGPDARLTRLHVDAEGHLTRVFVSNAPLAHLRSHPRQIAVAADTGMIYIANFGEEETFGDEDDESNGYATRDADEKIQASPGNVLVVTPLGRVTSVWFRARTSVEAPGGVCVTPELVIVSCLLTGKLAVLDRATGAPRRYIGVKSSYRYDRIPSRLRRPSSVCVFGNRVAVLDRAKCGVAVFETATGTYVGFPGPDPYADSLFPISIASSPHGQLAVYYCRRESCVVAVYDEALQTVFQIQCYGEFEHWGTTNGMVLRERDVIVCLSSEKEWLHVFAD